jgi:hypothetical protein
VRRAAKRDLSEPEVLDTFKAFGWSVLQISVKDGPDFFASKRVEAETPTRVRFGYQRVVAVECKTGKRKLRPGQVAFSSVWQGEYVVLRTADEALEFLRR